MPGAGWGSATLDVRVPGGYEEERRYVLEVVLGTILGLRHVVRADAERDHVAITLAGHRGCVRIADVLFATRRCDWLTEASLPRRPLATIESARDDPLPLLYALPDGHPPLEPGERWLPLDVFGSAFFMLTRYEELVRTERDAHGRFPATASIALQEGFLERPIVHEYADLLWSEINAMWPAIERHVRVPKLRPTHDVDWPVMPQRRAHMAARSVAADLVRRRDPVLAVKRVGWEVANRRNLLRKDPYDTFDELMDLSEEAGTRSAFYFMSGVTRVGVDGGYSLADPRIASILRRIHLRGHEIGLHPSYDSFARPEVIAGEFDALRTACARLGIEQAIWGGRQHFLRWENPITWRAWDAAALDYDSTLGFPSHAGFRTGVCIEYPAFDVLCGRQLTLCERPLIVMEGALLDRPGATHQAAEDVIARLRERCSRHGGEFTFLWHNSKLLSKRDRDLYRRILRG